MKKIRLLSLFFSLILIVTLFSGFRDYPDDPPNGYTGSSGTTCASCHSGGSFGGSVIIAGVPASISPSTSYSISVTTAKTTGNSKKAGFQLNVLNGAGSNIGTLSSTASNVAIQSNYAEHSESSTAQNFVSTSGSFTKTWTFNWTSPATTTNNNITFYVSSVIGNGSGTSGDQVINSTASGTFTPVASPLTVTQVSKTNVTCKGAATGTATVNATGGSGCSYTYNWSNGQSGAIATGLVAGTYSVTATCGASSGSTSVTITEPATALTTSATGSTLACIGGNNGTATATASGGGTTYTYLWSNGQTGANQNNLTAGTYNVTITDNNGCSNVKSATVSNPTNSVSASASTTAASCTTGGSATVTASNGTAPYTYLWSNGQTTQTINGLTSGSYIVTVTDNNGCKTTANATVSANTTAPPSTISGSAALTCSQTSLTLAAPNGAYTYAWSNGESTPSITVNTANTYTVTVTNTSNGCTSSGSKTITEDKTIPTAPINGNTTLTCSQAQISLSSSGNNSFQWAGPSIIAGTNSATMTLNATGTYSLTVTSLGNGCTNTNSINITENKTAPPTPTISPTNPTISCANSFVTLNASLSSSFTQQWNYNGSLIGTGAQINASQAGSYLLVVTDPSNGCTASNTSTVNSTKTTLNVIATGGKITCANPTVNLSATSSGAVSYNWTATNFNATQQNPTVNAPGTYTVVATDINGCTGTAQAIVTSDTQKPTVTAAVNGTISCTTPSVTLTASSSTSGLTYTWASTNGFSATGNPTTTQQAGTVTVTATNPLNGCSNTATVTITSSNDKPILATKGGTITCKDSIANIGVTVTGNTTGLTYKWVGANGFTSNSASANVKTAGDYVVTVTASNGCSSIATAKVILDNQKVSPIIESSKSFICSKDTIKLAIRNTSGFSNYLWSNTEISSTIAVDKSGIYQVTVTGINGCIGTASVTVSDGQSPKLTATADSLTCAIDKLILNAQLTWGTPIAPSWTGPNGFTSSVLQPEVSSAGTYTLSVNPADGCASTIAVVVKENKTPPSIVISAKNGLTSCNNVPIVLKVKSSAKNNTYLWTGADVTTSSNDSIVAGQSGKYIVKVTDEKGCVALDSAMVTLFPTIKPILKLTACDASKGIATISISGGKSPFTVKDNKGTLIDTTVFEVKSNLFPIIIADANGCTSTINTFDSIFTTPILIDKTVTKVKDATEGKSNGGVVLEVSSKNTDFIKNLTYLWSNNSTAKDLNNVASGKYCVTVSNQVGCSVSECFDIKNLIATEDVILAQLVHVYPNPVSNQLNIVIDNAVTFEQLSLLDVNGRVLLISDKYLSQLDMTTLPAGTYYIKITDNKGSFCIKKVLKM